MKTPHSVLEFKHGDLQLFEDHDFETHGYVHEISERFSIQNSPIKFNLICDTGHLSNQLLTKEKVDLNEPA